MLLQCRIRDIRPLSASSASPFVAAAHPPMPTIPRCRPPADADPDPKGPLMDLDQPTGNSSRGFARRIVRNRRWIALAWVVVVGALAPLAGKVEQELEVAARVDGSESAIV